MSEKSRRKKTSNETIFINNNHKNKKPITERIRRERINKSLEELKSLILQATNQDVSRYAKMEKADILDMTVKYIKGLQTYKLNQGKIQDPNQTPITSRLTQAPRQKKMKTNPSRKPKPRRSLNLDLPPIPISAGNPNATMETSPCVAKDIVCNDKTVALKRAHVEIQNHPVAMKRSNHVVVETPSHVSMETPSSTSNAAMETQNVSIETSSQVTMENSNNSNTMIQDHASMQMFNQVSMETSNCVAMETFNCDATGDSKNEHAQTYNFQTGRPIGSVSQHIGNQESEQNNSHSFLVRSGKPHQQSNLEENTQYSLCPAKREPFTHKENITETFSEPQFYNESLSPIRVTPSYHTSPKVRLPGMECFIKNINTNNLFLSEKENGHFDPTQCNSWLMGFDYQEFPLALWRPW